MPGYNHPSDCGCGWCVKASSSTMSVTSRWRPEFKTIESYVNPNALCPVCREPVFFYQSEYGGRVFFDELGPPWPKHPCTISIIAPILASPAAHDGLSRSPAWSLSGWVPLIVTKVSEEEKWWVVSAKTVEDDEPIRLALHGRPELCVGAPASFSGWNENGAAILSYFAGSSDYATGSSVAYKYSEHVFKDPDQLCTLLAELVAKWQCADGC